MTENKKDNKTSILSEAILEFNQIMEAANINAKEKLAEKYKNDFDSFLNEELEKNNKKISINESNTETKIENNTELNMENKKDIKEDYNSTEQVDDINIQEFPIEEVENTTELQDDENEFNINIEDIEKEIEEMEKMSTTIEPQPEETNEVSAVEKLKELYAEIGNVLANIEGGEQTEIPSTEDQISEPETNVTEPENNKEEEMDEIYSQSLSANKRADSATSPRPEYFPSKENKLRIALRNKMAESFNSFNTKLKNSLKENKKNVKELNSVKKQFGETKKLVEGYKVALEKYRVQLQEMAVFNTNLANVNNILLNENLALTKEDKIKIITDFKNISTIAESEKKYSEIIAENKTKKPIIENIEDKITVSVQSSSKQILDESINKNNSNNISLDKIKKNINYIENRNKK